MSQTKSNRTPRAQKKQALAVAKPHFLKRLIRKCWMPLALLIITLAIVFSLFRALTPWAKEYKSDVEQHLSSMLGQPVKINDMETSWYWFVPVLKLNDVTISDGQDHVLQLKKLLVGINLFGSLWHWQVQPGILYVEDAQLTIHQKGEQWEIDGLAQEEKKMTLAPTAYIPVLAWLLEQQKIVIKHVSADVYLNNGAFMPLKNINLTVSNHHGHYRFKGGATLLQLTSTKLAVLGDMQINSKALNKIKGHVYLSLHHFNLSQWKQFFPKLPVIVNAGKGNLELWLDFARGKISGMQSKIAFQDILWHEVSKTKPQEIQSIKANLAWNQLPDGWQLSGDHILLQSNGLMWPENVLSIQYKYQEEAYHVFAKTLLIAPLLKTDISWPESMHTLFAIEPMGELYDTQIHIQQGNLAYILSRFANLTWKKYKKIPGVSHVSGVLYWQPNEGRLEMDGQDVTINSNDKPKVTFEQVNGAIDWKSQENNLNVTVERLVLAHPELLVSAKGELTNYSKENPGNLQLSLEFSAKNAEQWKTFIPAKELKPKLNDWLQKDVKHMDKVSGRMVVNGPLANFPFDKQEGEFSINAYITGLDLRFAKRWPVTQNINAYLRVHQRLLEADIVHANFKQVETDKIHLSVPDLGLDHERLLVHGQINGNGQEMLNYVFDTPLRLTLKKLNMLEIQGPLGLDLSLDVPLYPEDDQILVQGQLTFDKNRLLFKKLASDLSLDELNGALRFNEHGATESALTGRFLDAPMTIQVTPVQKPKRHTEIKLETNPSVKALRQAFGVPILKWMHGKLPLTGVFDISGDPRWSDRIHVASSLEGMKIDLPKPFGKEAIRKAPFSLDIHFDAEDAFRVRFNYDKQVSSDLWVSELKGRYDIERGEVRLGGGQAKLPQAKDVRVVGELPEFRWPLWKPVLSNVSSNTNTPSVLEKLRFEDIKVGHLLFLNQSFKDIIVSLNKAGKDLWVVKLKQKDLACRLHYQTATNTLNGQFEYLYLDKPVLLSQQSENPSLLTPKDIPNLNIDIADFKVDNKQLGQVVLKSKSTDMKWTLQQLEISSPAYQLIMQGNWVKQDKNNQTAMEAQLTIKDLAKGLARFQVPPVVGAHQGTVHFEGGWPGGLNAFSLNSVKGQLQMTLKDGRITHFSPETEQKLGLGKLLSVLSLQTIPRRLKLDFSDLAHDGYSFDVFKGSFTIKHGILNTSDSYLDGPVAYVSMKGDLDVSKHLYDLTLLVAPKITASLPVVATIAGGPIVGAATWVVSKIINDQIQKISGYTYSISGTWLDPVIQPVIIHKKAPWLVPQRD